MRFKKLIDIRRTEWVAYRWIDVSFFFCEPTFLYWGLRSPSGADKALRDFDAWLNCVRAEMVEARK